VQRNVNAPAITLEQRLDIDRVRALYATAPASSAIGAVSGALWVVVFAAQEGLTTMLVFLAVVLANQAARVALWQRYRKELDDPARTALWARRYTWTMVTGGLIWGTASVLFFRSDDPARQVFILVAAYGQTSGATAPNAHHPPAMILFIVMTLLPVMVRVFLEGGLAYNVVGIALLMQIVLMILFGLNMAKELRASIRIRHDNVQLIEELRAQTEMAQDAQRRAEQANLAKSQFFAAASHDLRQPLQALGLFAASLREFKRDPEDARRVDQILSSVDVLESLFDELLDISKLDAGYVKPVLQHVTAESVFEHLQNGYAPFALRSGLALSFDHAGAVLHSDPVLLERVLGNLLSNALRYTPAGSVTVRCVDRGASVAIEVADTGPGIPPEEHERVFDEFYQLGNPERDRRKGLGLGLATAKRIAQLLGTRVMLASEPGRGATFSIEVPRGDAARVAPPAAAPALADVDVLRDRTIAIVDDERDVRDGLAELLSLWRCRVVAAASAREVVEAIGASPPPDVLIADYRLAGRESGIDAIVALRERYGPGLPALLLSGDTSPEIFRLVRAHRLPLLSKPVRAARLRAALSHLLSRSREPARAAA
jgi:signal transduction histidine kinase/ActR/RegA family two-component response regulator